jgi:hypothetical protein
VRETIFSRVLHALSAMNHQILLVISLPYFVGGCLANLLQNGTPMASPNLKLSALPLYLFC